MLLSFFFMIIKNAIFYQRWVETKQFVYFMVFHWEAIKYQREAKYFQSKCLDKGILIEKTLRLVKS